MTLADTWSISDSSERGRIGRWVATFSAPPRFLTVPQGELARSMKAEFAEHERKWKADTQFASDPMEIYLHASYARIIGMGQPAVSLIVRSMAETPAHWFYALRAITGENPVTPEMAGNVPAMTKAWLRWASERNYI